MSKRLGRVIACYLREARLSQGLTQEDLAAAAGVGRTNVTNYESGGTLPSLEAALIIAEVLGRRVEHLWSLE